MKKLIPTKHNIPQILLNKIDYRLSDTCDKMMALLSFVLTNEGKKWWLKHVFKNKQIITKLSYTQINKEEIEFIEAFDLLKKDLYDKIKSLAIILGLNQENYLCCLPNLNIISYIVRLN